MLRLNPLNGLAATIKHLPFLRLDSDPLEEAGLYYRRACLAAAEERYDVALIFCAKAVKLDAGHLPTLLLAAQIHHWGVPDFDEAVRCYRKVIAVSGYDEQNPYCAAASQGLDDLVRTTEIAVESAV